MDKVIARLKDVTLRYHEPHAETEAVARINIEFGEGSFTALVGPSGCGKTTILSMLAGIIKPSSGEVEVFTDTGYMLQRDNLLGWRNIESNVLLGLEIKRILNNVTKGYANELLKRYGLEDFKKLYPHQLSGGMKQKAALIRTLVLKPGLLLLDEPFSALDYQTRLLLADEVHEIIRNEGCSAVLVTHDISEAISMCDRVIVLSSRPAHILKDIAIELSEETPLKRRNEVGFKDYFNVIWKEMIKNEQFI